MQDYEVERIDGWRLRMRVPPGDLPRIQYLDRGVKFNWKMKKFLYSEDMMFLSDRRAKGAGSGVYEFSVGLAPYLYQEFRAELPAASAELLRGLCFSGGEGVADGEFKNLRPGQAGDLRALLRYRRGLFQTYTGYGKTEVIATLVRYVIQATEDSVLLVCPTNVALGELRSRVEKLTGHKLEYFSYENRVNAINLNGFLRSGRYDPDSPYWGRRVWLLADEVEHCVAKGATQFYRRLGQVERMYGFSATSDKLLAEPIRTRAGDGVTVEAVREGIGRNLQLVRYFGTTVVFQRPSTFSVRMVNVVSSMTKRDVGLDVRRDYASVYSEISYELFTSARFCRLVEAIAERVGTIYIPMFRLQVIDHWVANYFQRKGYTILVISSRGYEVYSQGELLRTVDLDGMKRMIEGGEVDLILGTKSSYSALDIPSLSRCMILYSKSASTVIQAVGRTARKGKFDIYSICPMGNIPIYSKDLRERQRLFREYYGEGRLEEMEIDESFYYV